MMNHIPFGGGASLLLSPTDLSAGVSSKICSVKDVNEFLVFTLACGAGAAGANPVVSLEQFTDNTGATALPLGIERVYWKKGTGVGGVFTKADDYYTEETAVTPEEPAGSYDSSLHTPAEAESMLVVLVRPVDLMEDYTHVRMNVTCPGAKVGMIFADTIGKAYQAREIVGPIDEA